MVTESAVSTTDIRRLISASQESTQMTPETVSENQEIFAEDEHDSRCPPEPSHRPQVAKVSSKKALSFVKAPKNGLKRGRKAICKADKKIGVNQKSVLQSAKSKTSASVSKLKMGKSPRKYSFESATTQDSKEAGVDMNIIFPWMFIQTLCFKLFTGVKTPKFKEACIQVHSNPAVRDLVLALIPDALQQYHALPSLATFERAINQPLPDKRRADEKQKKAISKITSTIYKRFKPNGRVTKETATEQLRNHYELWGGIVEDGYEECTRDQISERLFGGDRKLGLHNDVVRELLMNETLYAEIIDLEFLQSILKDMNAQTVKDIETNIVSKFRTMTVAQIRDSLVNEDGSKTSSFKLPWSQEQNREAIVAFLDKLLYRATCKAQPLPRQAAEIASIKAELSK